MWPRRQNQKGWNSVLNLDVIAETPVAEFPFPFMTASNVVGGAALEQITRDFPAITAPGVFPLSGLKYGDAFARLIEQIKGSKLESLLSEKFKMDLAGKPLMITVRGQCHKRDGRIHTDSKDKILTCLLYLNEPNWKADGGRLRLLRDGRNLDNMIAEVPPQGGNFIAFKRTDLSWHGHAPFEGQRRSIMFNWLISDTALAKNVGRHKLSALFKKIGIHNGY